MSNRDPKRDTARELLSDEVLPSVDIPTGEIHTPREFRLPDVMRDVGGDARGESDQPDASSAEADETKATATTTSESKSEPQTDDVDRPKETASGAESSSESSGGAGIMWALTILAIAGAVVAAVVLQGR